MDKESTERKKIKGIKREKGRRKEVKDHRRKKEAKNNVHLEKEEAQIMRKRGKPDFFESGRATTRWEEVMERGVGVPW